MQPSQHPDPRLSVNIYCSGRLSEVLCKVVRPLWNEIRPIAQEEHGYLWAMRYARRGEHLKLRFHGGTAVEQAARERLPAAMSAYLDALNDNTPDHERLTTPTATPIDAEDHETDDASDRTFRWTTYKRSHISLGSSPYQDHDDYVAALTHALARGTEVVLERLDTNAEGVAPFGKVQGLLLQLVIAGLHASGFDGEQRATYLRYHRDWLLRAALKYGRSGGGSRKLNTTLEQFGERIDSMGDGAKQIERIARQRWRQEQGPPPSKMSSLHQFEHGVTRLLTRLAPLAHDRTFHIDPFARDPLFPPLFRVLHGMANQLGLNALNESFAHHLLLTVATDGDTKHKPVALAPEL